MAQPVHFSPCNQNHTCAMTARRDKYPEAIVTMRRKQQKRPVIERAAEEAAGGRLWRAKELLSGRISSGGYSPEAFAAYGRVLADMHDSKEAGKFLFLSGMATNDERELVELFLSDVRGKSWQHVLSRFPSSARRISVSEFPERVQSELKGFGVPDRLRNKPLAGPAAPLGKWGTTMLKAFGITIVLLILAGLANGVYVAIRWLFLD